MEGEEGPVGSKWRVVLLSVAASTATTFPVFLTGALAVVISRRLSMSVTLVGILIAAFFAAAVPSSAYVGGAVERIGSTRVIRVSAVGTAAAELFIGLFVHGFASFLGALVVAGVTNGAMQPAVNLMLARAIDRRRQGTAFGIKQAAIPVATLLSGLAIPLVALTLGWRFAYLGGAVFALAVASVVRSRAGEVAGRGSAGTAADFRYAPLIVLALGMALGAGAANSLGAFLVSGAVKVGFSVGEAGYLAAFGSAVGVTTRVVSGYLADRRNGRHFLVVAGMLIGGALGYVLLSVGVGVVYVIAVGVSYAGGWGWNGLYNFAVVVNHRDAPAKATGITQAGAYVGSVFGPVLFGLSVDHLGFAVSWRIDAVVALVAAATVYAGRSTLIHELRRREATAGG